MLCISQGLAAFGAISIVAQFELYYDAGFTASWWVMMRWPIAVVMAISGWVTYRYRETRVMTMAQMFEIRYSKKFRVFCGILGWVSGVINMGIFPAVTAKFFIYFCGLPPTFSLLGLEVSTFITVMLVELSLGLLFTFLGGMVVVMVTDFIQGIFCNVVFLVILVFLFFVFDWDQISSVIQMTPEGASKINPYKTSNINI